MEIDTNQSSEAHAGYIISTVYEHYRRNMRHVDKFGRMETKVRPKKFPKAVFEEAGQ